VIEFLSTFYFTWTSDFNY